MDIEIHTCDNFLAFHLMGTTSITAGESSRVLEGVDLKYIRQRANKQSD